MKRFGGERPTRAERLDDDRFSRIASRIRIVAYFAAFIGIGSAAWQLISLWLGIPNLELNFWVTIIVRGIVFPLVAWWLALIARNLANEARAARTDSLRRGSPPNTPPADNG